MSGITAKIIADSRSVVDGKRITTFELEYPRFIHAELMTHRVFSRNAMSSRAVPIAKMIEQVMHEPATPVHWGKNQAGMQAKEELVGEDLEDAMEEWMFAARKASYSAQYLSNLGVHKQVVNRILEPFQRMKTVVTSTEWDNFFWLRAHEDAQPEIKVLADLMYFAMVDSPTVTLKQGEWHTPYYGDGYWREGVGHPLEDALMISSSCCAQVSYRKLDEGLDKAKVIFEKLIESKPCHASPTEHQATPMIPLLNEEKYKGWLYWQKGMTHIDRDGSVWSGNFQGWVQHRQLIKENVCNNYKEGVVQ